MNAREHSEVHEIAERLDRWAIWARWIMGGVGAVVTAGFLFALSMEGRVSNLESSRDSTAETLKRIDQNVGRLTEILLGERSR